MSQLTASYEIRLYLADGTLSIVMLATAASDRDAENQARDMLNSGIASAQIWHSGEFVSSVPAHAA
ncbi:MAG: hypothetical protein ISS15_06885 [Alphaproteobacteria bacterium]|nr:hypothetical protein [Alphaproteobacteria bacterium]MBL7097363.1 hypothetical protein [Alphaproteobacteria bacterium]